MKGSTFKRCTCPEGRKCPKLKERRHGVWYLDRRLLTSKSTQTFRRGGFGTKEAADQMLEHVEDLVKLAKGDKRTEALIGDMIFDRSKRGGTLPRVEDVARRLGLGRDPGAQGETVSQLMAAFLATKRRTREESTIRSYEMHVRVWIDPVIGDVLVERLTPGHIEDMLVTNPQRDVSAATRQRVFATLRAALNMAVRQRLITWNPCLGVELESVHRTERRSWSPEEAKRFIAYTADDDLGLLFRVMVYTGARRGEVVGLRWSGAGLDRGVVVVQKTVLELGGKVTQKDTPKSRAGERRLYLGPRTVQMLREHRKAQLADRLLAGEAWQDNDLIFCRADGSPWPPDYVTRRLKRLAEAAGVPVLTLHESGRHTGNSLWRESGADQEIRKKQIGHAGDDVNDHYTHFADKTLRNAAAAAEAYVEGAGS